MHMLLYTRRNAFFFWLIVKCQEKMNYCHFFCTDRLEWNKTWEKEENNFKLSYDTWQFIKITLYNVCAVLWGCSVPQRDIMSTMGAYLEYCGWCSVPWGDIMTNVGDILSTVGVFSTVGGIMSTVGGYLEYRGVFNIMGDIMINVEDILSTVDGVQYRGGYHDTRGWISWVPWGGKSFVIWVPTVLNTPMVLMISPTCIMISPTVLKFQRRCPLQYWTPLTILMISPTCIMISLTVLKMTPHGTHDIPHSTHDIPHGTEYPHGTQDIPHGTEHPHGTQDIPHGTHDYPPRCWTPHSTEHPPVLHTLTGWKLIPCFGRFSQIFRTRFFC